MEPIKYDVEYTVCNNEKIVKKSLETLSWDDDYILFNSEKLKTLKLFFPSEKKCASLFLYLYNNFLKQFNIDTQISNLRCDNIVINGMLNPDFRSALIEFKC